MDSTTGDGAGAGRSAEDGEPGIDVLLQRYLPALEDFVQRHAGEGLAQKVSRSDLVQSVCREILEDARAAKLAYQGEPQFRRWLFDEALRKILGRARYFRAQARDGAHELPPDAADAIDGGGPRDSHTPSRSAEDREELARFRAALEELEPEQRAIVQWVYFEERPHREVAERLGITEAHSRVLLSRALSRIAKIATREKRE